MTDKTPNRANNTNNNKKYSPIILPVSPAASSPQKNLTGLPRVARDVIADIYNNIQKWNDLHIEGASIVKQIGILKSYNPNNYSTSLEELTNSLYNVVQKLKLHHDLFDSYAAQIGALVKLDKQFLKPLFISHSLRSLADLVEDIATAYKAEFKAKEFVLENIAHSKNKDEVMFHAACWIYQINITSDINMKMEILLIESGHRKIV